MKLGLGSSQSMTYAWIVVKSEDYDIAEAAVYEAKRRLSMKLTHELKYKMLKRHKRKADVLDFLSDTPIRIYLIHLLKEKPVGLGDIPVANAVPVPAILAWLHGTAAGVEIKPQLIIDMTKWRKTDELTRALITNQNPLSDEAVKFGHSGGLQLLQLVDIVCGYFHEYLDMLSEHNLPPCTQCLMGMPRLCHYKRKGSFPPGFGLFRQWFRLLIEDVSNGKRYLRGYHAIPVETSVRFRFLDCVICNK